MLSDAEDWGREPGRGRYARPERERRFLVLDPVPAGEAARLLEDRYLDGMRLRLRRVTGDGRSVYKLTQKVRPEESDPSEVFLTNIYLSAAEHARLSTLPGSVLVKTRVALRTPSRTFVVDDFRGALHGLRLAEVEVADLGEPLDLPPWLGEEVTHDNRFSGAALSLLEAGAWQALLNPA